MKELIAAACVTLLLSGCASAPEQSASNGCGSGLARGIFASLLAIASGASAAAQGGTQSDAANNYMNAMRQTGLDKDPPPCGQ